MLPIPGFVQQFQSRPNPIGRPGIDARGEDGARARASAQAAASNRTEDQAMQVWPCRSSAFSASARQHQGDHDPCDDNGKVKTSAWNGPKRQPVTRHRQAVPNSDHRLRWCSFALATLKASSATAHKSVKWAIPGALDVSSSLALNLLRISLIRSNRLRSTFAVC